MNPLKCPACFNSLTEIQVGKLTVDACQGGCGGIWFDAFELERADETSEVVGEPLLKLKRDKSVQVDFSRKRECPRCPGIKLHRHFFSAQRRVEVDQCPNCAGYWLDAGELAQIRAERSTTAPSQNPSLGISPETIRYLYRLHLEERDRS